MSKHYLQLFFSFSNYTMFTFIVLCLLFTNNFLKAEEVEVEHKLCLEKENNSTLKSEENCNFKNFKIVERLCFSTPNGI